MNRRSARRRQLTLTVAVLFAVVIGLLPQALPGVETPTASAHNLQTKMVYMFLDQDSQALLDTRISGPWTPGTPVFQAGDEIGLVIKVVPRDGTTTGVGGHVDFYIPNGVTVTDAAYVLPDGTGGFDEVAMKGQSPIAIGDGPIGAEKTSELIGMAPIGPNINGVTTNPVVATDGLHRGTIAGVYGDTGIFYSTDPDTAFGSWQRFSNPANPAEADRCGLVGTFTLGGAKTIKNNSGDTFVPCNKWDAEQMYAWGVSGTTYTGTGAASSPIVDYGDGRGNAPWGFASGVAGPQSGYAWFFDWDEWRAGPMTATAMKAAMDTMGPWQRVKYPGSRVSYDQPGLESTTLGFASVDGSNVGVVNLKTADLAPTVSQTDATSPKTIRWAVGQLTELRPEYVWVQFKIDTPTSGPGGFLNAQGCPLFHADTFGGDAGGTDNGKDHLWRYYEPSTVTWNGCLASGKPADVQFTPSNGIFSYKIKVYNLGSTTQTGVVVKDTLVNGLTFISASPPQNSGPNPLIWNVGTLQPNQKFEATLTVKATGSGYLDNCLEVTSNQGTTNTCDTTVGGAIPFLVPTKSVTPTSVAPGGTVQYTVEVKNIGSGPSSSPTVINEMLEAGFTYLSKDSVMVNGTNVTGTTTVNATDPMNPIFTVPAGINAGQSLILKFSAQVGPTVQSGSYCNTYSVISNGVPLTTGSLACVQVGGGRIGDTIFRDWNGNGVQDAGEEGLPGVTVTLSGAASNTAVTDSNGQYLFTGLTAGSYTVTVPTPGSGGVPSGYTLTADPDGSPFTNSHNKTLTANEVYLGADWGYQPGGAGVIGDSVFNDLGNDGVQDPGDPGIPGVEVCLFADTNGDGTADVPVTGAGTGANLNCKVTNASGNYSFTGLAEGVNYVVVPTENDGVLDTYFSPNPWQNSTASPQLVTNLTGTYNSADFGYFGVTPSSIGDEVCIDSNSDGSCAGETPLPNVTVILLRDGLPFKTTTTSVDGTYTFGNLGPGSYTVQVDSTDPDIPAGFAPSVLKYNIDLLAGQDITYADFPFVQYINKQVDKVKANANDTLTYSIDVFYPGSELLDDVTVSDNVPAGATYFGNDSPPATTEPVIGGTGLVEWHLGSNTPGKDGTVVPAVTFLPTQDSYIKENSAATNFGSATEVIVDGNVSGNRRERPLIQFDLSSVCPGVIQSAELVLQRTGGNNDAQTITVRRATQTWVESTVTWTSYGSGGFATVGTDPSQVVTNLTPTVTWDVKAIVQSWCDGTNLNQGFLLDSSLDSDKHHEFGSSESANPPKLKINGGGPEFAAPLHVTNDLGGNDSLNPSIVYDGAGVAHTVFQGKDAANLDNRINIYYSNNQTGSWSTPVKISPEPPFDIQDAFNPQIVVDGGGNLHVVFRTQNTGDARTNIYYVKGTKSGTPPGATYSWGNVANISNDLGNQNSLTPDLAVDSTGKVHVVFQGRGSGDSRINIYYSNDGGTGTWTMPIKITPAPPFDAQDSLVPRIAVDGSNNLHVVFQGKKATDAKLNAYYTKSTNSGVSWSAAQNVSNNLNNQDSKLPAIAVNSLGVAHVVFQGKGSGDSRINIYYARNPGGTFTTPEKVTKAPPFDIQDSLAPEISAGPDNTMHVVWQGQTASDSGINVYYTTITAGAIGTAENISDDLGGQDSLRPDVAASSTAVTVVFDGKASGDAKRNVFASTAPLAVSAGTLTNYMQASPTLVGGGATITVKQLLVSDLVVDNITPSALAIIGASGAGATCGSPTLLSANDDLDGTLTDSVVYEWTCTSSVGALPGSVSFGAYAVGTPATFAKALSNSVLVVPTLTFQVKATGTVDPVVNTAQIQAGSPDVITQLSADFCYALSDSNNGTSDLDALLNYNFDTNTSTVLGNTGGDHGEALTWNLDETILYTTDRDSGVNAGADKFGTLNTTTGVFTGYTGGVCGGRVACTAQPLEGSSGNFTVLDIDGLSFNHDTGVLYGVHRRESGTTSSFLDLLLQINPATGLHVEDAFGAGQDYVVIRTNTLPTALYDVDDISFHPQTNELYAVANWAVGSVEGTNDRLILIDYTQPGAGNVTDIARITNIAGGAGIDDMEGLSFLNTPLGATLFGVTGDGGAVGTNNRLWAINPSTAVATQETAFPSPYADFESLACQAGEYEVILGGAIIPPTTDDAETAILASIGDRIWADLDGDGVYDPGEPPLAGVEVCATEGANVTCATTDGSGNYRIYGLDSTKTYTVDLNLATVPTNYLPTKFTGGSCPTTDCAVGAQATVTPANFAATTPLNYVSNTDFGLRPPGGASIGDTVWIDADEDGVVDPGEQPLDGVTVELYDSTGLNLLATTTTDGFGKYTFNGLYAGNYVVKVDPNSIVTTPQGANTTVGAAMEIVDGGSNPLNVNVPTDTSTVVTADFPYNWAGSIGDYLWYDTNGNGTPDGGEPPVTTAAVIDLYVDDNNNGQVDPGEAIVAVTFVDGSGGYLFENLPPGNYVVKAEEQTVLAPPSSPNAGDPGRMVATTGSQHGVNLAGSQDYTLADFGFIEGAEMSGTVFHDVNHNGILEPGEPGLPGVTVTLVGTDIGGNPVNLTTTTGPDGKYDFIVPPGSYTISYNPSDPAIPLALSDLTTSTSVSLSVPAGVEVGGIDFGRDNPGKIGDRVWNDTNGNGSQNAGEPGIGGVTVQLYLDADGNPGTTGDQTLVDTILTSPTGAYQFVGLPDTTGSQLYVTKVVPASLPAGYTPTGEGDTGTPCASLPGGICDNQIATSLTGGATITNVDFGYTPPPTSFPVSGTVWNDTDGDGVKDGGETGISGVDVCLKDINDNIVACTTTNGSGDYTFPGIPNGSYTIVVDPDTLPNDAYVQTGDPNQPGVPCTTCDDQSPIVVNGAPVTNQDFGYQLQPASIIGTVCIGEGNGLCDGSNVPQSGVQVFLTFAGPDGILGTADDVVISDTTDGSGNYAFSNLLPGTYSISTVALPDYTNLADADGNDPNYITVILSPNQNKTDQDFELDPLPGAIGDRVWLDENGNGVQDAGEAGIPNLPVTLTGNDILGNPVSLTTYTDLNGGYLFEDLLPSNGSGYAITVTPTAGLIPTYDENGIGTPNTTNVVLAGGEEHDTADFGYNWVPSGDSTNPGPAATGAIGDRLWVDVDGDGVQDPGEPGLGGVPVKLLTDDNNDGIYGGAGDNPPASTTTAPDGSYIFDGVPPGSYVVQVNNGTTPPGYTQTGDPDGTLDNATTSPVVLAPGDVYVNADFGYQPNAGTTGSIGDTVWLDADRNNAQNAGEPGIPGVTVSLIKDANDNGIWDAGEPIIATDTTDANGNYSFDGLPTTDGAGTDDYLVWVSDTNNVLSNLVPTYDADGAAPASGVQTGLGISAVTNLTATPVTDQDFAFAPPGQDPGEGVIGDTIFMDTGNGIGGAPNGTADPGEGLEGVTVELYASNGTTLLATTTTDENGNYTFGGLKPTETYVVKVDPTTLPNGGAGLSNSIDPDGGTADQSTVDLSTSGPIDLDQDFGYTATAPGAVSGTIWDDSNGDGALQGGEPGRYEGVTVALLDPNGNVVATTTTDSNGNYSFPNLPPGSYTVDVTDTGNVLDGAWHTLGTPDTAGQSQSDPKPVTVSSAATTVVDFGYYDTPASIGDFVWDDLNGNGIQDGGEPGIDGVLVTLLVKYPNGATSTVTTVTGDDPSTVPVETGWYSFGNLLVDENYISSSGTATAATNKPAYIISVATPVGYAPTLLNQGGDDTVDSDNPAGEPVAVNQAQYNSTIDFGYVPYVQPGSIGDRVWLDENGNGVQDAGEAGIPNLPVTLTGTDLNGNPVSLTTYTDVDGGYLFDNVLPSNGGGYAITVTPTAGLVPTYDENGIGTPNTTNVVLAGGEEHDTADFGYNWVPSGDSTNPGPAATGAIGDRLWVDVDGDGVQDPGEPGLGGVPVKLLTDDNNDGIYGGAGDNPPASTTTAPDGSYIFDGVPPGSYVVQVNNGTTPPGYTQTGDPDGTLDNATTSPVVLAPGDVYVNADFGYQPNAGTTGSIGDTVWLDADRNNAQNAGEPGIPGVTVSLIKDANDNGIWDAGEPIIATDTTDANGNYSFDGLPTTDGAGTDDYLVWVSDTNNVLSNLVPTYDADGAAPASGVQTGLGISAVTNLTATPVTDQDFAFAPPGQDPGEGVIGDTIFMDTGNGIGGAPNGTADPGEGLEGVTVELYASNGTTLLATTTTDENGNYTFGGLNPTETYVVKVDPTTLPNGGAGLSNSIDPGDPTPNQSTVNLSTSGPIDLDQDFGYTATAPGAVSGTIWDDSNGDGALQGGEPGRYEGVTVALLDPNGNVVATTTTDSNGNYSFPNLPPGTYTVDVTDTGNVLDGAWHTLGTPDTAGQSQSDPKPVTVSSAATTVVDFGYYDTPASIGDFVWDDLNGNGIQDGGEPGIDGVLVTLLVKYPNGATSTVTTVTGDDPSTVPVETGWYSFGNLLVDENYISSSGTATAATNKPAYIISVATPVGYAPTLLNQGGDDTVDSDNPAGEPVAVNQAQYNSTIDFGYVVKSGAIGDRVWLDENGNGVQDAGEAGIPNLPVTLTGTDLNGNPVSLTTYTDVDGGYLFDHLSPSNGGGYAITVTPTAGLVPTYDENGIGTPNTTNVVLAVGEEHDTADFGYNWVPSGDSTNPGPAATGAIGDRLWVDVDGDGVQDPGEPGLGGVPVKLLTDDNNDGIYGGAGDNPPASTTTAPDGSYIFDGVPPGSYVVQVNNGTTPPGYTQTGDPDGTLDNQSDPIVLAPGDVYVNADFGYQPNAGTTGSIGDTVWLDADRNNAQNAGEPGIPGVTVSLIKDANGNGIWDAGEAIIATDTTDANGNYSFDGLPTTDGAGTDDYLVWVSDTNNVLSNLVPTYDADGAAPASGVQTGLGISAVTNLTATPVTDQDFAFAPPGQDPGEGVIGDTIFMDTGNGIGGAPNGTPDPGEGLEGVTVELYASNGTTLLATTTTDENGNYTFGGLKPTETYVVKVDPTTLPNGGAGLSNSIDPGDPTPNQSTVNLSTSGPIDLDQDFGYTATAPGAVSGTIWDDSNGDGALQGGEPGRYEGVTVALLDPNGNVVATTTTDSNGNYSFPNLPPGTYTVDVTDTGNVLDGAWHTLGTPDTAGQSQSDPKPVTVSSAATTVVDFGYYDTPASIGDFVWDDLNGNGIQDGGEPGIDGVLVTLLVKYPNGATSTVTTVTGDDPSTVPVETGWYSFGNLLVDENYISSSGTATAATNKPAYIISVATPVGYAPTLLYQGGSAVDSDDPSGQPVAVDQGQYNSTIDFGFRSSNNTYAINDINQTPVNVPVSGDVLTNDYDLEDDNQTVTSALADTDGDGLVDDTLPIGVATPVYGTDNDDNIVPAGTITLNPDGTYTYTPALDFTGTVPVEYTITDDNTLPATDSATLTIEVVSDTPNQNDPPVAQDDTASTEQDVPVSGNVMDNDSDPDGDPITVTDVLADTDCDGVVDDPITLGTPTAVCGTDEYGNTVPAGELTINPDGTWTFDPEPGFTGDVPVDYTIEDPGGLSDDATLTITIVPDLGNETFANDDANLGPQGVAQVGNILDNDFDPEGNDQDVTLIDTDGDGTPDTLPVAGTPIQITQNGNPIGTLTVDPETGEYVWEPEPDFVGTAVIPYEACDDGTPQACATATLYLTTLPRNNTYAINDINQTPVNVPVSGDVLTNDYDLEDDNQTVTSALADTDGDGLVDDTLPIGVATPVYGTDNDDNIVPAGTITLNPDGTYTYTPALDFTGTVPVEYTITDDNTLPATDSATLTIEVVSDTPNQNDPPVAQDDTASTEPGVPVSGNVMDNDSDPDGDPITVTDVLVDTDCDGVVDDPITLGTPTAVCGTDENGNTVPAGELTINPDGTWTFDPEPDFTGDVPVDYTIEDPGGLSDDATLTITIVPDLGNETFANDDANLGPQGVAQVGNILDNDFDPEGNDQDVTLIDTDGDGTPDTLPVAGTPIQITQNGNPIGTLTVDPETGEYVWEPEPDFVGTAVIPYEACDDGTPQACATATLYLTTLPRNNTYAINDINQTPVNVPVSGDVLTNDYDLEDDNQTVTSALIASNPDGVVNDPLTLGIPTPLYGTNNDGNIVFAGTIRLNPDGTYTYAPALDFTGTVPVEYTITDDNTLPATDSATLTIEVVSDTPNQNDPPVAQDDTASTEPGVPVSGNVMDNDSDPDGDPITVTDVLVDTDCDGVVDDPITLGTPTAVCGTDENGNTVPAGELTINPDGTWTFDPEPDFTGDVPVDYTIEDPGNLSDDATLTITIVPDLGNETFANDDANLGPQGVAQVGNILDNDFDPEGNDQDVTLIDTDGDGTPDTLPVAGTPIQITQNGNPIGTLTVDPETGEYVWQPVPGFVGTAVIPYEACDDGTPQACATATLYLTTLSGLVPDITPIITAVPNVMTGPTPFNLTVRVLELNGSPTVGLITVRIPKDIRWTLAEPYNSGLTVLGVIPVNNADWTFSETASHYVFKMQTASIPANGFSTFGIKAAWDAGQTQGSYTITSQIVSGSGSENRYDNNSDAEKLDYFIN